jgi:hypothetical protein
VLARELCLLLLLVPVLPVVHHPGDRRVGVRRDLDEVEVLPVCVLPSLVGRLDPDLRPVLVDEPDPGDANRLVDPILMDDWTGPILRTPTRSQRLLTKPSFSSSSNDETAAASSGPDPRLVDSVEPPRARSLGR